MNEIQVKMAQTTKKKVINMQGIKTAKTKLSHFL